jgi:hypothetical protein
MRGRLPQALESLPPGVREVPCAAPLELIDSSAKVSQVPAVIQASDDSIVDSITEDGIRRKPPKEEPGVDENRNRDRPLVQLFQFLRRSVVTILIAGGSALVGYFLGRASK